MIIIGIRGEAGSGKDTVADYLQNNYGFKKFSFATALKKIIVILTGWSMDFVNGTNPELRPLRETEVHPFYKMTCRQMMQFIGTDLLRNQLNSDIWVEAVRNEIKCYIEECKNGEVPVEPRIVFTDARFPNEALMIQELGGKMYKIVRPGKTSMLQGDTKTHISEIDFKVDNEVVILNDETLISLFGKVDNYISSSLS